MPWACCRAGRAFIPRRQLMEFHAGVDAAWIRTFPLVLKGDTLTLDGDAAGGEIRATVLRFDGSVAEGFAESDCTPLSGAFTEGKIHFKGGSLRRFGREPVRIVVHMDHDARLHALGVI